MAYVGAPPANRVLSSADIAQGSVTLNDINFTDQPTNMDIAGTIDKHTMRLADGVTITGDVTISDDLVLSKISDDGNAITMTNDGSSRTITGSGSIEASTLSQTPNQSLTGMSGTIGSAVTNNAGVASGVIGSAVTGSPALTLSNATEFPAGHILNVGFASHKQGYAVTNLWANVTNLSVTLTPKSTSSEFLIIVDLKMGGDTNSEQASRIAYTIPAQSISTTATDYVGVVSDSRTAVMSATFDDNPHTDAVYQVGGTYLHSPTLSGLNPITYTAQARNLSNGTSYVNRTHTNAAGTEGFTTASSITVMEIAG